MDRPVVSVITTVYNGERFLAESVESVLAQAGVDLELVVVDDGSTDGTAAVLDRIVDPRAVVVRCGRRGRAAALNEAIAHSRGSYLAVQDADDRCLPGRLAVSVGLLEERPDLVLVGGGEQVLIDEHGTELGRRPGRAATEAEIRQALRAHHSPFPHSSVTMRRAAVEQAGGYDESLLVDLDLDLFIRLADRGGFASVPDALVATRRHDQQYFAGRRGPTRDLRRRVANRRVIDKRAQALTARAGFRVGTVAAASRELGSWVYWRSRRMVGPRPVLPVSLRQRLDRRWSRHAGSG